MKETSRAPKQNSEQQCGKSSFQKHWATFFLRKKPPNDPDIPENENVGSEKKWVRVTASMSLGAYENGLAL
jgi:hypothetical protein